MGQKAAGLRSLKPATLLFRQGHQLEKLAVFGIRLGEEILEATVDFLHLGTVRKQLFHQISSILNMAKSNCLFACLTTFLKDFIHQVSGFPDVG